MTPTNEPGYTVPNDNYAAAYRSLLARYSAFEAQYEDSEENHKAELASLRAERVKMEAVVDHATGLVDNYKWRKWHGAWQQNEFVDHLAEALAALASHSKTEGA